MKEAVVNMGLNLWRLELACVLTEVLIVMMCWSVLATGSTAIYGLNPNEQLHPDPSGFNYDGGTPYDRAHHPNLQQNRADTDVGYTDIEQNQDVQNNRPLDQPTNYQESQTTNENSYSNKRSKEANTEVKAKRKRKRRVPDEQRLMEMLLDDYHKYSRPVENASKSVEVKFGLTLVQISDMDEVNQVLTINVWLEQEWVDERLTWDPKDYNNLQKLRIPCEKLWLPDIVLYNSADDYTSGYMKSKAMVDYNGTVFWPPPAKFRSSCKIDITYFPFDDQKCELKFGSWTYDGFQVDLTNRSATVDLENYVFSGEWELMDVRIRRKVVTYACCIEPYPDVRFTIVIRRKTLYYLFNIIFPCLWLTILSLLGFWLPPDSGEKITLGITVLLAFSVFMLLIAESMPATSEFVPLIGIYLTVTMGMTSLSIILTVFVLQLHHVGPHKRRVPRWLRSLTFDVFARLVCMHSTSQTLRRHGVQSQKPHLNVIESQPQSLTVSMDPNGVTVDPSVAIDSGCTSYESSGAASAVAYLGPVSQGSGKDSRGRQGPRRPGAAPRKCNGEIFSQRNTGAGGDRVAPSGNALSPQTLGYQPVLTASNDFLQTSSSYDHMPHSQGFPSPAGFRSSFRSSFRRERTFAGGGGSFRGHLGTNPYSDNALDREMSIFKSEQELDKYQELVTEWQFVAHVMDRLLFWLFLFVALVSSLAILVVKPWFKPPV